MCGAFVCVCTCKTERGERGCMCFFPEKRFLSYTYNKSIANKTTTFKQRCLTHTPLLAHTHKHDFRCRHTLLRTPLGFSYSRVFCLSPSVPGGPNEMRQKRKAVREKESFCWWRTALLSHPHADGPCCCCTSGHMPKEQQQQSSVVAGARRWVTGTCVCVCLMHDSEAQLTMCGTERLQK